MKKVNTKDLLNMWLKDYHNTDYDTILNTHPLWKENPTEYTSEFYDKYAVTQEQHDEWLKKAKKYTMQITKIKGELFNRSWGFLYLNVAPKVK